MTPLKPKLQKRQVDLLLLSIIRAYDHPGRKSEEERLAEAREALFGEKRGGGRVAAFDDIALFKILDAHRKRELDGLRRAIAKVNNELQTPEWEAEIARDPKPIREEVTPLINSVYCIIYEFDKYVAKRTAKTPAIKVGFA